MSRSPRVSRRIGASLVLLAALSGTAALAGVPNPDGYVGKETLGASMHIRDYQTLGLPAPASGQVWIRMGYDALLVSRTDGEVEKVVKGVFT